MFDRHLRPIIDPPLNRLAVALSSVGMTAHRMTGLGLVLGLMAAAAIALGHPAVALPLFLANRLADGLDGPLARLTQASPWGGFADIIADFVIYGAIPVAFAVMAPELNALPAAVLLFSFYVNGAAFLAYAALAAERGLHSDAQGKKSIYYVAGLAEGGETIAVFLLMMALPALFPMLAWGFAALTVTSAIFRCILAWTTFRQAP